LRLRAFARFKKNKKTQSFANFTFSKTLNNIEILALFAVKIILKAKQPETN